MISGKQYCNRRMQRLMLVSLMSCGLGATLTNAGVSVSDTEVPAATNSAAAPLVTTTGTIAAADAKNHTKETNTVCGVIASTKYLDKSDSKLTYLNFDQPYPNQTCAVLIPGSARSKFKDAPDVAFNGKNVCVTGLIASTRNGKPQITIDDPSQIKINDAAPVPPAPATNAPAAPNPTSPPSSPSSP